MAAGDGVMGWGEPLQPRPHPAGGIVIEVAAAEHLAAVEAERDALRAEVALLDAICAHQRSQYQPPIDDEFGLWAGGPLCEHPSLTGDRCDACGWKQDQ